MTALRRVEAARVVLAASAVTGVALVWMAIAQLHPTYGSAVATLVAAGVLWWWRGVFSRRRVVLWIEERVPSLRYSLATLVESPPSRFTPALERSVSDVRFGRPLGMAALRLIGIPLAILALTQFAVRPALERTIAAASARGGSDPRAGATAGGGRLVATVTPPSYSRQRSVRLDDPTTVAALVGSTVRFSGDWTSTHAMPTRPTLLRLDGERGTRMVSLEPRDDSTPRVVLELPARDSVLASTTGAMRLAAQARDDLGLTAGWFEIIVSSGSGESFTFRTAVLGRATSRGDRVMALGTTLRLDSLELKPGDVVHLRAVARDANPASQAEAGSSETRTLRVPRPGENDSVSVTPAPPPEVGQSELSQRMLIILTERLVAQVRRISADDLRKESGNIGREQGKLRKRVGEIIFSRLTGEEHSDDDGHDHGTAPQDSISPAEALLRAADKATDVEIGHSHGDEGPIVNVNRPLLEAFNAMWQAERELGVAAPRQALPHMRAALDAIQRARAAERLYLRGRAPRVVIDEAKVRLAGKRDDMSPATRNPRASALDRILARRARFSAALRQLHAGSAKAAESADRVRSAVDSLLVLRMDVLGEDTFVAARLEEAIGDLRAGREATQSLLNARRALFGAPQKGSVTGWSGVW